MSLDPKLRQSLSLPAVCAPMFLVSGPDLVREACKGHAPRSPAQERKTLEKLVERGSGIDLIHDIPTVADLVARLRREYAEACRTPAMA
jgi:NAD(P)H-dependent flavin oxidoreductase YrpB (nitropropane dioxygenase family)